MNLKKFYEVIDNKEITLKSGLTFKVEEGDILPAFLYAFELESDKDEKLEHINIDKNKIEELYKLYEFSENKIMYFILGNYQKYYRYLSHFEEGEIYLEEYDRLEVLLDKNEKNIFQIAESSDTFIFEISNYNSAKINHVVQKPKIKPYQFINPTKLDSLFYYLALKKYKTINETELAFVSLLAKVSKNSHELIFSNIDAPLIVDIIKYVYEEEYHNNLFLDKLDKINLIPLLNFSLKQVSLLYPQYVKVSKRNLPSRGNKKEFIKAKEKYDLINLIQKPIKAELNVKKVYDWLLDFMKNKIFYIVISKTKNNNHLAEIEVPGLLNVYVTNVHYVLEADNNFDKEKFAIKYMRNLESYAIIDANYKSIYIYKHVCVEPQAFGITELNFIAKLFDFNLKELVYAYIILMFKKEHHQILLQNIDSKFMEAFFRRVANNYSFDTVIKKIDKELSNNTIDFDSYDQKVFYDLTELSYIDGILLVETNTKYYYIEEGYTLHELQNVSYETYRIHERHEEINLKYKATGKWWSKIIADVSGYINMKIREISNLDIKTKEFVGSELYFEIISEYYTKNSRRGWAIERAELEAIKYFDDNGQLEKLFNIDIESLVKIYRNAILPET